MKKINDLNEKRFRTETVKDALGNRQRIKVDYIAKRLVKTVDAGPRFGHFIIDGICYNILFYIIDYLFEVIINVANLQVVINLTFALIGAIILLLLYPAFYFVCEYFWQRTPGKFLTKTIVIDEYGNKPSLRQLALRSLVRLVPFEAFSCLGNNSYGWHDKWSHTYVVTDSEFEMLRKLQAEQENTNNKTTGNL